MAGNGVNKAVSGYFMDTTLRNKILSDIKKNGYLTELNIGENLRKKGWTVQYNQAYLDPDLNKSREIDIIASYSKPSKRFSFSMVSVHLVIEAKMSHRPWVVFCTDKEKYGEDLSYSFMIRDNYSYRLLEEEVKGYIRQKTKFRGRNYYEAFKEHAEHSKIYEAVLTSSKAASYLRDKEESNLKNRNTVDFKFNEPITLKLILPVIVLDGKLVKASLKNDGDPDIEETGYIPIVTKYHDTKGNEETFMPDLITFNFLDRYILSITKWVNSLTEKIDKGREELWQEYVQSENSKNSR